MIPHLQRFARLSSHSNSKLIPSALFPFTLHPKRRPLAVHSLHRNSHSSSSVLATATRTNQRTFDFSTHIPYSSPMNILVYSGDGTSRNSLAHTVHSLRALVGHHYDVMRIDAEGLASEPWEESTSLLIIPGGRDLPYTRDLNGATNDRIRAYVNSGGRFLGICAGGYYASDRIVFEAGKPMEVRGPRELKFFAGECRGTVYPGFVYDSESGADAVRIQLNPAAFSAENSLGFDETSVYFNGGGYFVDAEQYGSTKVLAWYGIGEKGQIDPESPKRKAAMIACEVGQGLAVLSGVHPEYDSTMLDSKNPEYGPEPNVVSRLREKERERRVLLRGVLAQMGLKVMPLPESSSNSGIPAGAIRGVPDITPLYLASIRPQLTAELADTLYGLADATGDIYQPNDTFQLVPSPSHPVPVHVPTVVDTNGVEEEKMTKNIVLCPSEPPLPSQTPEFDMGHFFRHLQAVRGLDESLKFGNSLMYGQVVTSTQTMLDKNFELCQQLPDGFVCNATIQVSGRGRGRNSWISPPGCLQFSLVLRHPVQAHHASAVFVQYLVALAVVESVCSLPGYEDLPLRLKWPNDIYAEAPLEHPSQAEVQAGSMPKMIKIGGVLVNSNFDGSGFLLVIGK